MLSPRSLSLVGEGSVYREGDGIWMTYSACRHTESGPVSQEVMKDLTNHSKHFMMVEIRTRCGRTMDYDFWIVHQRSQWWIQYGGFYIVLAHRSVNDGSFVALE
ncbi:unnamed protein product [Pleuronectes platessa]|uniref:Uncharacterized protein n=1 Tax=Pleuronectes platessa TaxID=8262 RepID=A0A9N7VUI4_PLEPL|nr:unnamed protein product [Pleuronectes platessa]